jgi:hypothetical protein
MRTYIHMNISNNDKNKNITNLKEKTNMLCTLIPNKTKHNTLFTR